MSEEKRILDYQERPPRHPPLWWHFIYGPGAPLNWVAIIVGVALVCFGLLVVLLVSMR